MAMLDVTKLSISFGGLRAVDELTMQIEEGGLVGLIGPNGAGKTTVFNMLTGVYLPTEGESAWTGKPDRQKARGYLQNGRRPYLSEYPPFPKTVRTG